MPASIQRLVSTRNLSRQQVEGNIRAVLQRADRVDVDEGLAAYPNYHWTMQSISAKYGVPLHKVVGAFCALSPNNDYMGNLRSTVTLLKGFREGLAEDAVVVTTYNRNRAKAWRIVSEDVHFYSIFRGLKVRSFYRNILEPTHPEAVTIDGHMVNVCRGQAATMSESGIPRSEYRRLRSCFHRVARDTDLLPCQVQAILWFAWKRLNGIVYNPQLDLFACGNQWKNRLSAAQIKPFR